MFRLTREVRFAINEPPDPQAGGKVMNGHGGFPSLTGIGRYFTIRATLAGELNADSQYLVNIKQIDDAIRERGISVVETAVGSATGTGDLIASLYDILRNAWSPARLESLSLALTPFLSVSVCASELPMVRLSQKFEFSAAHRLHNPALSDEENRKVFGKCNNPHGHGHNYEVQVTLVGHTDVRGRLIDVPTFERIVAATVIDRFDHKHLNAETVEFRKLIPSVENIARVVYALLKPVLQTDRTSLASVTVWETPKTWAEYSE